MVRHLLVIATLAALAMPPLLGQEEVAGGSAAEDLAKAAQNPVGALISLPFQNNTTFDVGPRERTQNVLNIQPVWPFSISKK